MTKSSGVKIAPAGIPPADCANIEQHTEAEQMSQLPMCRGWKRCGACSSSRKRSSVAGRRSCLPTAMSPCCSMVRMSRVLNVQWHTVAHLCTSACHIVMQYPAHTFCMLIPGCYMCSHWRCSRRRRHIKRCARARTAYRPEVCCSRGSGEGPIHTFCLEASRCIASLAGD